VCVWPQFGKDLEQYKHPGWEDEYIDYKMLKLVLGKILEPGAIKDEVDGEFFQVLEDELEKVNRAFHAHAIEVEGKLDAATGPQRTPSMTPSVSGLSLEEEGGAAAGSSAPSAAAGATRNDPAAADARNEARHEAARQSEQLYYEAYRTLGRLQTFVWINAKGFQKIMKKYDKRNSLRGTGLELLPEFEKRLEKEAFCSGKVEMLNDLFKSRRPDRAIGAPPSGSSGGGRAGRSANMMLLAGNANPELAEEIAARLGVPLTPAKIGRFVDGEVSIQVLENVRNSDVYIIQPTCPPVNDNLMELLLCTSAVRRAAAAHVTAIVPYYGYARQDRKERSRVPIAAADVAKMMEAMGVDRVCCVDLHCGQIQGFFSPRTPVDNLYATPIAISYFGTRALQNVVVVSPDAGGVARAKMFREGLEASGTRASLAMIIPRTLPEHGADEGEEGPGPMTSDLVGHVSGCDCIIVDDMIDTAGTLCTAANELTSLGARRVFAFATHGLFSGQAAERIEGSSLEEVVVANTIPLSPEVAKHTRKVRQISVGKLLAQVINCIHTGDSVSRLFDPSQGAALLA
jgi:ribose-phosphate pyrophosphokinase